MGDGVGYELGKRYGPRVLALPILARRSQAIDQARARLQTKGGSVVLLGRFIAFLRAVMPLTRGARNGYQDHHPEDRQAHYGEEDRHAKNSQVRDRGSQEGNQEDQSARDCDEERAQKGHEDNQEEPPSVHESRHQFRQEPIRYSCQ